MLVHFSLLYSVIILLYSKEGLGILVAFRAKAFETSIQTIIKKEKQK